MNCQRCQRKSQLFLCHPCQKNLGALLDNLISDDLPGGKHIAGYIESLFDKAVGNTRTGESVRRSTERNSPMPVNLTASELFDDVHDMLTKWVAIVNTKPEKATA